MSEALANPNYGERVAQTPRYPMPDYSHAVAEVTPYYDLDDKDEIVVAGWLIYQADTGALRDWSDRGTSVYPEAYIWQELTDSAAAGVPAKQARDEILAAVWHGEPEMMSLPEFLAERNANQ